MSVADPRRVLVVDDERDIRDVLQIVLEEEGYDVRTAENGKDALQVLADWRPDVVILDWQMPVMDGPAFADVYRQMPGPHAPVVLLTAAHLLADRCRRIRAEGCIAKPFDIDGLLKGIEEQTHQHAA